MFTAAFDELQLPQISHAAGYQSLLIVTLIATIINQEFPKGCAKICDHRRFELYKHSWQTSARVGGES